MIDKMKFATNYHMNKSKTLQEDLLNGIATDKERYMYDYLSSIAARLDTCMLQLHYELKRIHKKPVYLHHFDQMLEIVPAYDEYSRGPAVLRRDDNDTIVYEKDHSVYSQDGYGQKKQWGDAYNPIERLEQSEALRKTQIEYV